MFSDGFVYLNFVYLCLVPLVLEFEAIFHLVVAMAPFLFE